MELVTPGIGLMFWMVIAFSIVVLVLKKFAWKPILGALRDREDSIDEALRAADKARKEMSKLQADNEKIMAKAKSERDAILKEARDIKETILTEAKEQAVDEAKKLIESAKETIRSERAAAINEIKEQVAVLAVDIAGKILQEKLSHSPEQNEYIEHLLRDIRLN
jgi:F-type H+-transporting ATPase subunit b